MMTIKTYGAVDGVCLEACEVVVPNSVGSFLVSHSQAIYIKHNHDPPEKEWEPIPILPPPPPKYEPSDPLSYPAGRKLAKQVADAAEKLKPKRKKAQDDEAHEG